MSKDVFLGDKAGQRLDGLTCVLLLSRVDDRPGTEAWEHPRHPAELCRWEHESDSPPVQFGFELKIPSATGIVVKQEVPHDPGGEVGEGCDFHMAIGQHFVPDHLRAPLLK
jgi:hypothetical protein